MSFHRADDPASLRATTAITQSKSSKTARAGRGQKVLANNLRKRLAAYAAAAAQNPRLTTCATAAIGAGMLGLAQPGWADIIYTPANIEIVSGGAFQPYFFGIPLNDQTQLTFTALRTYHSFGAFPAEHVTIGVQPASGNALAIGPLARSYRIGPDAKFTGGAGLVSQQSATIVTSGGGHHPFLYSAGPWAGNKTGYLGVRFLIDGQTHYGWVALSISSGSFGVFPTGDVSGYAYETIANEAIRAGQTTETPEPGTLGLLALGSLGLGFWRRRQEPVTSDK